MAKRKVTLPELKDLMEYGNYRQNKAEHGWIYYEFPEREKYIIIKTVMVPLPAAWCAGPTAL